MTLQLETTANQTLLNHCLVYGPAKSGKTRLALTAPNPVILNTDNGLSVLREHSVPTFDATQTYDQYLQFENAAKAGQLNQFDTVIVDDLTELAQIYLTKVKPDHKNLMQAYGALNDEMMRVIRFWRNQSYYTVVFLCKQEKVKDEMTGGMIYGPLIPGKAVQQMLPYLVGSVYQMTTYTDPATQAVHEVLRCKRNNQYDAGDRSGRLSEFEFANLAAVFQKALS